MVVAEEQNDIRPNRFRAAQPSQRQHRDHGEDNSHR
jgi:hypothetical protein